MFDFPGIYDKSAGWINSKLGTEIGSFRNIPFRLGLDLLGGTHLVYEADTSKVPSGDKADAVEGVRDVIERRVNAFGVSEPLVQVNKAGEKWRVIVELAGIKDIDEAIKMIGETPLLEFKEQNTEPPRQLTATEKTDLDSFNKEANEKAKKALAEIKSGADFAEVVKNYTEREGEKEIAGDIGWIKSEDLANKFIYEAAGKVTPPNIVPEVVTGSDGLYILKVNEKRDAGTEVNAKHILVCFKGAQMCSQETSKEDALKKINELKDRASTENFVQLAKENSTEPGASETGGDLGWFSKGQMVQPFEDAAFNMEKGTISDVVETDFGYHLIYKVDERAQVEYKVAEIFVNTKSEADILPPQDQWKNTNLTGRQLKSATVEFDSYTTAPQVSLEFDDEGKQLFADITERNVGQPVAIFLDNQPISIPRVDEPIREGKAVISGSFDIAEAKLLSQRLNAGALPVPIKLIAEQTVGASLGKESMQKSLMAGIIGFIIVGLFMIAYYRLPGLLAVFAMLGYGILVLFVFKAIPVTLTLAGIAGFILSIGMAVDANVLIFERMKEEIRLGKPLATAIDEGFRRAWTAIRDGNVTTLLVCLILAWFGSSMIKGFAITLSIGILISMFSAIVVTKQLMLFATTRKNEKRPWLWGLKSKENK